MLMDFCEPNCRLRIAGEFWHVVKGELRSKVRLVLLCIPSRENFTKKNAAKGLKLKDALEWWTLRVVVPQDPRAHPVRHLNPPKNKSFDQHSQEKGSINQMPPNLPEKASGQ